MKTATLVVSGAILGLLGACGGGGTESAAPAVTSLRSEDCPKKQMNVAVYDRAGNSKGETSPEKAVSVQAGGVANRAGVQGDLTSRVAVADDHMRFIYFDRDKRPVAEIDVKKDSKGDWFVQGSSYC